MLCACSAAQLCMLTLHLDRLPCLAWLAWSFSELDMCLVSACAAFQQAAPSGMVARNVVEPCMLRLASQQAAMLLQGHSHGMEGMSRHVEQRSHARSLRGSPGLCR